MTETTPRITTGTVRCQQCGADHEAVFHHYAAGSGPMYAPDTTRPIYEVTCTVDWLTDYYTADVVTPA